MQEIVERLAGYSDLLAPIREAVNRYLKYPSTVSAEGVICVGHRPWVAPQNYMFWLFPTVGQEALNRYSRAFRIRIPEIYIDVLRQLNGAKCFGMILFGAAPSMLGSPPLLDRTKLQCQDLSVAATEWARGYRAPAGLFHFGYRYFSPSENVGYFLGENDRILSLKKSGNVVGEWTRFADFLSDELPPSEKLEEELYPSRWPT